jgi:hypothetical protein
MTKTYDLVTRDSVLNLFRLDPHQLNELLETLHCQTYQVGTRLYIQRSAKRVITSLLAPRYANTPMQKYLDALASKTFLYQCDNCGDLLFFTELQLGEHELTHTCLLERRTRHEYTGRLELVGSGPLKKLVDRHYTLFPLEAPQLLLQS